MALWLDYKALFDLKELKLSERAIHRCYVPSRKSWCQLLDRCWIIRISSLGGFA
jgi:hypothetical protein